MALTAIYDVTASEWLKEDVSQTVEIIDPTETPIQANISVIGIDNAEEYDWFQDSLDAADDGGFEDGFLFEDLNDDVTIRTKRRARSMIQARGIEISDRLQEVGKHAVDDEIGYQLALRGEELKRDCEAAITSLRSPVVSADGVAPLTSGIPSWLATNNYRAAGGNDPTITNFEPVAVTATVDGTSTEAVSEANVLDVLGSIYDQGGNPDMISVGRDLKQAWSGYMLSGNSRSATQYQDQGKSPGAGIQVVGAVDYYVSDFGTLAVVPNRFQRARDMLILDTSLWEVGEFRGYQVKEMGRNGDSEKLYILHDFCLIARDEAGSGVVADADGSVAMTA